MSGRNGCAREERGRRTASPPFLYVRRRQNPTIRKVGVLLHYVAYVSPSDIKSRSMTALYTRDSHLMQSAP